MDDSCGSLHDNEYLMNIYVIHKLKCSLGKLWENDVLCLDYLMLLGGAGWPGGIYHPYHLSALCLSQFSLVIIFIYLRFI